MSLMAALFPRRAWVLRMSIMSLRSCSLTQSSIALRNAATFLAKGLPGPPGLFLRNLPFTSLPISSSGIPFGFMLNAIFFAPAGTHSIIPQGERTRDRRIPEPQRHARTFLLDTFSGPLLSPEAVIGQGGPRSA